MKLTKADLGKEFNTKCGLLTIVYIGQEESCATINDDKVKDLYILRNSNGICADDSEVSIVSRHDPRSWLTDMPNLGDIKDGWIACDGDGDWCSYTLKPEVGSKMFISEFDSYVVNLSIIFNMPTLTGDQWKDSLISVAELKQWQADNKG